MTAGRVTDNYRNFLRVAAWHNGNLRGRACRSDDVQFEVEGSSVQDALGLLRNRVDEVLANLLMQRDSQPVTSPEYVAAFRSILGRLGDGHRAMLKARVYSRSPETDYCMMQPAS